MSLYRQLERKQRQAELNSQFCLTCLSYTIGLSSYTQTISNASNAYEEKLLCIVS